MKILGIETSCDETGVAIYDSETGLIAHILYSQIKMHAQYGGVVPELASRDHVRKLTPLVEEACKEAKLSLAELDGIAYTMGPGLMGALLTGASFARSLAYGLGIPCLGVHHLEAHIMAAMLEGRAPAYPYIALLVSGGHSQLLLVEGLGDYQLLGETLDDAVGEAFDKTAKLIGLEYPGGPKLAVLAEKGKAGRYRFPRPMTDRPGLDLSFSGLKTFALNTWHKSAKTEQDRADIALAFQQAVCETLVIKCKRAMKQTGVSRLVVAGGVSANLQLRRDLQTLITGVDGELFFPKLEYCTDNGAMVAYLSCLRMQRGERQQDLAIEVKARLPL